MEKVEKYRFYSILHVAANYIDSYCGDLFLDLMKAEEQYDGREVWPMFCVRKTGADLIDRYMDCLDENTPKTLDNAIKMGQKSLGIDFTLEITSELIILTNYKVGKWELSDLECRLKDYGEVLIVNKSLV